MPTYIICEYSRSGLAAMACGFAECMLRYLLKNPNSLYPFSASGLTNLIIPASTESALQKSLIQVSIIT